MGNSRDWDESYTDTMTMLNPCMHVKGVFETNSWTCAEVNLVVLPNNKKVGDYEIPNSFESLNPNIEAILVCVCVCVCCLGWKICQRS